MNSLPDDYPVELFDFSNENHVSQVREILSKSFEWYCSDIIGELKSSNIESGYLLTTRDKVISCIFVIDVFDSLRNKFALLFSASTDPDYRNRGCMTRLYKQHVRKELISKGYSGAIVALQTESLIKFYRSLNFEMNKIIPSQDLKYQMIDSFTSPMNTDLDVISD